MDKSLFTACFLLMPCTSCFDHTSSLQTEDVRYSVQGPIVTDTSVAEYIPPIYEQYVVQVSQLTRNIYIPFLVDSNTYFVSSHVAFKEINQDTILSSGGTADYFSETCRLLEKGRDYEFSFFLNKPEFVQDTVVIFFRYYPDSLSAKPKTLELTHSGYVRLGM